MSKIKYQVHITSYNFKGRILSYPKFTNGFGVEMYCAPDSYVYIFISDNVVIQFLTYLMGDKEGNYNKRTTYYIMDLNGPYERDQRGQYNKEPKDLTKEDIGLLMLKSVNL